MPANPIPFPALDNGMLAHLPVRLSILRVNRSTRFSDGSILTSASDSRLRYSWTLTYENLNQAEWQRIIDFVGATQRGAVPVVFADPIGNLLAQSGNLDSSIWLTSPGLTVEPFQDPDYPKAFIVTNSTPQPLELTQSVNLPGPFKTCFSLMAKWPGGATFQIGLADDADSAVRQVAATDWSRHSISLASSPIAQTRTVSITVPPTTQIIVSSPQLEIAASPGAYLETGSQSGMFPYAWLAQRSYDSQSNAPGAHSITLRIESLRAL